MIIAVDFDGTCVDHRYPLIGDPAPDAVETLRQLAKNHRLILWTMRSGKHLDDAVKWFVDREIELYGIQMNPTQHTWSKSRKCYANVYIDDAGFGAPLIHPRGFNRPCIDWEKVKERFLA
jgi:MoaA/NifB/PqqE/SkfB family radical SAM enzyme